MGGEGCLGGCRDLTSCLPVLSPQAPLVQGPDLSLSFPRPGAQDPLPLPHMPLGFSPLLHQLWLQVGGGKGGSFSQGAPSPAPGDGICAGLCVPTRGVARVGHRSAELEPSGGKLQPAPSLLTSLLH